MVRCQLYLEIIEEENLLENARLRGLYLLDRLEQMARDFPKFISQPRGRGLMCAFDLPSAEVREKFLDACYDRKMIVLACGTQSVRFRPSLTVTDKEIDKAMEIIHAVLKGMTP